MSEEFKTFYISGEAAEAIGGKKKGRKKRGGNLTVTNSQPTQKAEILHNSLSSSNQSGAARHSVTVKQSNNAKQSGGNSYPSPSPSPSPSPLSPSPSPSPSSPLSHPSTPVMLGGALPVPVMIGGKIKVELKNKTHRKNVVLQPKREKKEGVKKNRKSRKITFGLSSFHKRLTRAKKANKKIKEMPLDQLKKYLIEKKLIKPTSKAPESILRQIAGDMQIVDQKAL